MILATKKYPDVMISSCVLRRSNKYSNEIIGSPNPIHTDTPIIIPELILNVPVTSANTDIAILKKKMIKRKTIYDVNGTISSSGLPVSILHFRPNNAGENQNAPREKQTSVDTRMGI